MLLCCCWYRVGVLINSHFKLGSISAMTLAHWKSLFILFALVSIQGTASILSILSDKLKYLGNTTNKRTTLETLSLTELPPNSELLPVWLSHISKITTETPFIKKRKKKNWWLLVFVQQCCNHSH